jgi:translation initiation factor IF-3
MLVNEQIRYRRITLILENGQKFGDTDTYTALNKAQEANLDLVEVAPPKDNFLAVCRLCDYGKLKYKQSKQQHSNRSSNQIIKEMHISFAIADHDLATKNSKVKEFLGKKYRVRYVMELRGREKAHPTEALSRFKMAIGEFVGRVEEEIPRVEGRTISVMLNPK